MLMLQLRHLVGSHRTLRTFTKGQWETLHKEKANLNVLLSLAAAPHKQEPMSNGVNDALNWVVLSKSPQNNDRKEIKDESNLRNPQHVHCKGPS